MGSGQELWDLAHAKLVELLAGAGRIAQLEGAGVKAWRVEKKVEIPLLALLQRGYHRAQGDNNPMGDTGVIPLPLTLRQGTNCCRWAKGQLGGVGR